MIWSLLSQSPILGVVWLVAILLSLTIHEFSHALAGRLLGDTTAEREGRLTLNPLAHIDPLGFIMMLTVGFGWAKPVPFNPYALRRPARDAALIAFAGPVSNLLLMLLAGGVFAALVSTGIVATTSLLAIFLVLLVFMNGALAVFNLIPLPPLDGAKFIDAFFLATRQHRLAEAFTRVGPFVLLLLVLLSSGADIPIFSFISYPATYFCDVVLGHTCTQVFFTAFGY